MKEESDLENFIEKMERLYEQADETLKVDIAKENKLAKKGSK